jgi:hypothetical protein
MMRLGVINQSFSTLHLARTTFLEVLPDWDPTASTALTTLLPSETRPKTTCFPSSQLVLAVAAVGVGTSVGHRDAVGLVLQLEVLVLETISIDGFASSAVSSGEISTLDHEVRDDTVEGTALVSTYTVSLTEFDKVLHCLGNHFSEEIQYDVTCITATDVDAQSHSMSGYLLSRAIFTD